jgi:nucleoside-diphosphate-sugar epimerase
VAVSGAAGYVGQELLRQLEQVRIKATAVVRGEPELSVGGGFHDAMRAGESRGQQFDVVINLAHPTRGLAHEYLARTLEIVETVDRLVRDNGRIIHVSTQAVFGLALDRAVKVGPVGAVRDAAYVEAKIAAEGALVEVQRARSLSLDIVRLGNVVGSASPTWGVPLVQRLVTGRPVGIFGRPGFSNATDVVNVASYLVHLLSNGNEREDPRYHHLAEFAGILWESWIAPLADALRVEPAYADSSVLDVPTTGAGELRALVRRYQLRNFYRALAAERVAGSWTRSLMRRLPPPILARAKGLGGQSDDRPMVTSEERTFLAIMAAQQAFVSITDDTWHPPVSFGGSLDRLIQWLER